MLTGQDWRDWLTSARPAWFGAIGLVLLAILLVVLLNPNFAVRDAAEQFERQAGLRFESDGARLQFLPELSVRFEKPRVSAIAGNGTDLMQAESAVVAIPWRSLLTRRLRPDVVELQSPVFNFVLGTKGDNLWSVKGDSIDRALAQSSVPEEALRILTRDGSLKFLDERNGQSFEVNQADLQISFDKSGAVGLAGHIAVANQFTHVEAQLASLARLREDGTPIDATVTAPALNASFSGLLSLRNGFEIAGTFSSDVPDTSRLAAWMGLPGLAELPATSAKASGPLVLKDGRFTSGDIALTAASHALKGKLSTSRNGPRLAVSGALSTDRLSFGPLASNWLTTPLKINWIRDIDLDLSVSAFGLSWARVVTGPTTLQFKSTEGLMDVSMETTQMLAGEASGTLTLNASSSPPRVAAVIKGDSLALLPLAGTQLQSGAGGIDASVTAEGRTVEELISTLAGDVRLTVPQAEFRGVDVPASLATAAKQQQRGWIATEASSSAVKELTASFAFKDGIGSTTDLKADLAGAKIRAKGTVDLLRRAVDLTLQPAKSAGKPAAIHVFGPWGNPVLGPPAEPEAAAATAGKQGLPAAN